MTQLTLFPHTPNSQPLTIQERFEAFHKSNPHVYNELCNLARQLKARGRERYGIKSLFEALRWHKAMQTSDEEFKLNNNFTAFYARLLMAQEPELDGFFEVREQKV